MRKPVVWGLVVAVIALAFYALSPILLPFVAGVVLAYLADPLVRRLCHWGVPRGAASLGVVAVFVGAFALIVVYAVPAVLAWVSGFVAAAPGYMSQLLSPTLIARAEALTGVTFDVQHLLSELTAYSQQAAQLAVTLLRQAAVSTMAAFDVVALLLITPLVMFYLLRDWHKLLHAVADLLPRKDAPRLEKLVKKIDASLASFLRGQLSVCALLGLFYGVGLWAVGVPMGFWLGLLTGAFSFVPVIGMVGGVALTTLVALVHFQFADWVPYALMAGVFMAGQLLEGMVLTPKLVGDQLGLHPAVVIFTILAGGHVGGLLGVIVALPVAAVLVVLVREGLTLWKESSAYKGAAR
jgi:predicted PurR-regulated permease PerM